jgi:hypothetical protein
MALPLFCYYRLVNEDAENNPLPCAEKLVFDSQQAAEAAANIADYQHGMKLKIYRCRYCDLWHLSTA